MNTVDATLPSLVQPEGNMKFVGHLYGQWEFQDPKMEVLYQIRPYILVVYPLKFSPEI